MSTCVLFIVMHFSWHCVWLQDMSHKDLQTIENIKWDPPFPYDPASGWKKSSINVKNYGHMIHSSKVRFRFLHCQVSKNNFFIWLRQNTGKQGTWQ